LNLKKKKKTLQKPQLGTNTNGYILNCKKTRIKRNIPIQILQIVFGTPFFFFF